MCNRVVAMVLIGLSLAGCTFNFPLFPGPGPLRETQVSGAGSAKILLLEVSGMISSQEKEGLIPAPSLLARIKEQLTRAAQDDNINAVVLRINTPGGTVTASDIIYHELKTFKTSRKIPIVASIMDWARPGGTILRLPPENRLSGQISWSVLVCGGVTCVIQVPATFNRLRLWRQTSIADLLPGQSAELPAGTLGHEWDYEQFEDDYPAGRVWLSSTTVGGLTHHLALFRHASGALVFGAGTIQWAWGLDDHHTASRLPPQLGGAPDPRMQQATVNLLSEMGARPGTLQRIWSTCCRVATGRRWVRASTGRPT